MDKQEPAGRNQDARNAEPAVTDATADASPSQTASVTRSTAVMSGAILVSRITGFVRTWAMAFALGNTILTSAYNVANNLPNQIFELLAGGIISSVFLPVYLVQREKNGEQAALGFASNLFSIGLLLLGSVSTLATVFAPQVVFTQTFLSEQNELETVRMAVFFFRFFAIQILFYGMGGLMNSLLNAHRRFFWPMAGPIFNNLVGIITMFAYPYIAEQDAQLAMVFLAVGTTVGILVMFVVQVPAFLRLKMPLHFHIRWNDAALKESLVLALPVTAFVFVNLIVASTLNAVALRTAPIGPSTIQYAWLWYQLPYGVIAVALSTALFTEMSEASAAGDLQKLRYNIRFGLRTTLFTIVPLAVAIIVLAKPLAGLYRAGEFTQADVEMVSNVLRTWCMALPFFSTYRFLYRAFSALRDLKAFILIDACGRIIQIVLYICLTNGLGQWSGLGLVGLPLADAIAHLLLVSAMLGFLKSKIGSYGLRSIAIDGLKLMVAAALATIPVLAYQFLGYGEVTGIANSLIYVVGGGISILILYYLICRLFKVPETAIVNRLFKAIKKKP